MEVIGTIVVFSSYEGLVFGLVAVGVYLTLRVLSFPDLTIEGSYTLGGAIVAVLIVRGMNPLPAMLISFCMGVCAGLITALLNTKLRLPALLAGILVMVGLYSVNLRILGGPNVSLLRSTTIFDHAAHLLRLTPNTIQVSLIVALGVTGIFALALSWFLGTEIGLALRATGDNDRVVRGLGSNTDTNIILGVSISNGIVAVAGAVVAQAQGFADAGMGVGLIVVGVASLIIGEIVFRSRRVIGILIMVIGGAFFYRLILTIALRVGMKPGDLKVISAVLVIIAMSLPYLKKRIRHEWVPPAASKW